MKKKSIMLLISVMMMSSILLSGCGTTKNSLVEGKINVVTSFYPLYDFTKKIGGEHVNVINLVPAGVEPHDWAPKSRDMKNITKAEIFVYNGAGFEGWVDDFLKGLEKDSKLEVVEASHGVELLNASEEEEHEEESAEHEEEGAEHEEEGSEHEEEHDHGQYDPHVWVSPLSAKKLAENIKMALIEADAANEAEYEANYQELIVKLDALSEKIKAVVAKSSRNDIIVSHQAYGYLARDFGLNQKAVMGISPESEPTAQQMKEISHFAEEHHVKYILFEELASPKLAETMANDLNIETLVFNPIEGLTDEQQEAGDDYFTEMERNLISLEKALSR